MSEVVEALRVIVLDDQLGQGLTLDGFQGHRDKFGIGVPRVLDQLVDNVVFSLSGEEFGQPLLVHREPVGVLLGFQNRRAPRFGILLTTRHWILLPPRMRPAVS